jgi:NADH-quinone oxidoreductase subunit E
MPERAAHHDPVDAGDVQPGCDLEKVALIVEEGDAHSNLIALLQRTQNEFGYVPEDAVREISRLTGVPASRIYGILTFYAQFSTVPMGRHKVTVCHGTACHVAGATRVTQALEEELGVPDGANTPDMQFRLDSVACMGACSQAPVMRADQETYGNLTADKTRAAIRALIKDLGLEADYATAPAGGDGDE